MSFQTRFKERREALGISRAELASRLGVTSAAIGNYETGTSTPKADILFTVFDALRCDANYLFQDEMKALDDRDLTWAEPVINAYTSAPITTQEMICKMLDIKHVQPPSSSVNDVPEDSVVHVFRAAHSKEGIEGQTVEMHASRLEKLRSAKPAEDI